MVKKSTKPTPDDVETLFGSIGRLLIQVEMKRRDLGYRELTEIFNRAYALSENERNMRNKIARGTFSSGFLLMCLLAMGCKAIDFEGEEFALPKLPETGSGD